MKIARCRLCNSDRIHKVVDLGYHPLADTFLSEELLFGPEIWYPLQLGSCGTCGHVFTLCAVSPVDRYQKQDYSYESSNSRVSIEHFKEFAEAVLYEKPASADSLIVDIGSNDGTLLSSFRNLGARNVLGIDPSENMSRLAIEAGIPTLNEFFGPEAVPHLRKYGEAAVLVSANVVNHADDVPKLLCAARDVLANDGIFVFEVPYLLDLIRGTAFDTIYHEHVHYYGVRPLAACLHRHGFSIFKIENIDYMCGSIRVYARLGGSHAPVVEEFASKEEAANLYHPATYASFMDRVRAVKLTTITHLNGIRQQGGKIIGIGAATKGNTFLNYCRLDSDVISFITDTSRLKIGKLTPGSHIPIIADSDIDSSITHGLILAWNLAPMLKEKLSYLEIEFYVPQIQTLS